MNTLTGDYDLTESQKPLAEAVARKNLVQLTQLRWIAVFGKLTTIAFVEWVMRVRLPLGALGLVLAVFVAGNISSLLRLRWSRAVTNGELFASLCFDALILTALLYLSGGTTNPFSSLFLLQVILGAVLLEAWAVWAMAGVALICFLWLTINYRPLEIPAGGPDLFSLYLRGAIVAFALNVVLLVIFISRINANLRLRDERLAALRQRAAEEDHIVRMGLLAAGAAHELGTPLATIDVILGDWRRMPTLTSDPELAGELEDMRAEVARCKAIVTSVLISAGEARGEAASVSGLKAYLHDIFDEWKSCHAAAVATFEDRLDMDPSVVADSALRQALNNLLDNALEASPDEVCMSASFEAGELVLVVQDAGPGFSPRMLDDIGRPYHSSKGRLGGGLGLFLVVNVVRKIGGRFLVRNRDTGGAEVKVVLPLRALVIGGAS